MVDVRKLERLACLKVSPEQEDKITKSIDGVVQMFDSILSTELKVKKEKSNTSYETRFREPNSDLESTTKTGLNLVDDKYFIAPKVIKKD